ncbi:MAG: hypothetical protein QMD46_12755 [Methanomicrobiales archaeon]|nr:hypothetical protein [Methanomicrobiales archaeon]
MITLDTPPKKPKKPKVSPRPMGKMTGLEVMKRDQLIAIRNDLSRIDNTVKCIGLPSYYAKPEFLERYLTGIREDLGKAIRVIEERLA